MNKENIDFKEITSYSSFLFELKDSFLFGLKEDSFLGYFYFFIISYFIKF